MRLPNTRTLTLEYQRVLGRLRLAEARVEATRAAAQEHEDQGEQVAICKRELESIAFAVRILDPDWTEPAKPIRAKAGPVGNAPRGAIVRSALKALGVATNPMTAREIAIAIGPQLVRDRALTPQEVSQLATSLSLSLTTRREGYIKVVEGRPRRFALAQR